MAVKGNLLIINFVMDAGNPLLSHQSEAVEALSSKFNRITVITGKIGVFNNLPNVKVISTNWVNGKSLHNILRLYIRAIPVIIRGNFNSVFFHMTDLQCALLSPIVRLRNRKQYLWYAHTYKSKYLIFASLWVNRIITSTDGSCPIKTPKVLAIGQAIDENKFSFIPRKNLKLNKLVHIGRFDKSKNIDTLIKSTENLRINYPDIRLTIIGSPGNENSKNWSSQLISNHALDVEDGWLNFKPAIARSEFSSVMSDNGCFFHAYIGSLDKTLIESTLCGVPVVTLNPEYLRIFNSWSKLEAPTLEEEYISMRMMSDSDLGDEITRRRNIAIQSHSLNHWINALTRELQN